MTADRALTTTTGGTLATITHHLSIDPRLKSDKTRTGYLGDLAAFERWRGARPLSKLLVEEYAAELQRAGRSPRTINRVLAAVRWWARKVSDLALEDDTLSEPARRRMVEQALRVAAVGDVGGSRPEKGRHVAAGELSALMAACAEDDGPAGVRDAALIALAWSTGARVSELAGLTLGQVHQVGPEEYDLTIQGKGDKARVVYVYNGAAVALEDWLAIRGSGDPAEPVFVPVNKAGKLQREPMARGRKRGGTIVKPPGMGTNALSKMLERRAAAAALSQPVTWHDFRRSFAGNLLDAGADLVTVQKLMGHSSPTTTSQYDRRGDEVKRKAVRALHVPYRRRGGE
jgi:site-specific recombinase XerD